MDYIDDTQTSSQAYAEGTQARLKNFARRVVNGRGLFRELCGWESDYAPDGSCDVASLIAAMPKLTGEQFIRTVASHYNQSGVTSILQNMVDAGIRLKQGDNIYGVDQPDTNAIRIGLGYMRNVFGNDAAHPKALLRALEYAALTLHQPIRLPKPPVLRPRVAHARIDRVRRFDAPENGCGRASLAEQLAAAYGKPERGR